VVPSGFREPHELAWSPLRDVGERDLDHCAYEIVEVQTLGGVYVDDIDVVIFDAPPQPETMANSTTIGSPGGWPTGQTPPEDVRRPAGEITGAGLAGDRTANSAGNSVRASRRTCP
jgi:hypothetical protein